MEFDDLNFDSLLENEDINSGNNVNNLEHVESQEELLKEDNQNNDNNQNNDSNNDDNVNNDTNPDDNDEKNKQEDNDDNQPESDINEEDDLITSFLKENGIADPSKIKFENDEGKIEEVDFNSLSKKEQFTILKELTDPGLSDHEQEVVNYLRKNNMSFDQVVDYFAEQKLNNYLNEHPDQVHQKAYKVDDYNDDELYLADLKTKYPSFSDEELLSKLNIAKSDEDLFGKEVKILRENYKAEEDKAIKENEELEKKQYQDLQDSLVQAASSFNEVSLDYTDPESDSLEIEDDDKRKILDYLLTQDREGKSQFVKDIENPNTLVELAWLRTQGADLLSGITKYWKDTLKAERKKSANLEKQLDKFKNKGNNTVVVSHKEEKTNPAEDMWDKSGLI